MKKLSFVLAGCMVALCFVAMAWPAVKNLPQAGSPPARVATSDKPTIVYMKDGKLWINESGRTTYLEKEVVIGSTTIKADGTVIMKDGNSYMLKEGDMVNADGLLVKAAEREKMKSKTEMEKSKSDMEKKKPDMNKSEMETKPQE